MPIGSDFELHVQLCELRGFPPTLAISRTGEAPIKIAPLDPYPSEHVLHWNELELLSRVVALREPDLPHPGFATLFLHLFAPICVGEDLGWIQPTFAAAWREVEGATKNEARGLLENIDGRDSGFEWRQDPRFGWFPHQTDDPMARKELYTIRQPGNPEFPAKLFQQLLAAAWAELESEKRLENPIAGQIWETGDLSLAPALAESIDSERLRRALGENPSPARIAWVVETLLGAHRGELVKRVVPAGPQPRAASHFQLTIPLKTLPKTFGKLFIDYLNGVLGALQFGEALSLGSGVGFGDDDELEPEDETVDVTIFGDSNRGIEICRAALRAFGVPNEVQLSHGEDEASFDLKNSPDRSSQTHLLLVNPGTIEGHDGLGKPLIGPNFEPISRLDRLPEDPDPDGWRDLEFDDGGALRLCQRDLADSIAIEIAANSPEAAEFVFRLSESAALVILPLLATASTEAAQTAVDPWPNVRVLNDYAELERILADAAEA